MASFIAQDLDVVDRYKLLTGLVIPRPIGWIGTVDTEGNHNLAPFSFFNVVCANPPTVMFAAGYGPNGLKDSGANARATGEFTCNIVGRETAEAMNASSAALAPGESEFGFTGLTPLASDAIAAPRVAEAKATLECRVSEQLHIGAEGEGNLVVFGEVVRFHIDDSLLDGTRIDAAALDAIGRLAGSGYATTRDTFQLDRP